MIISIQKITAAQTYSIRLSVLRNKIALPHQFEGDLDLNTFHLGAFVENKLVGIATFMQRDNPLLKGRQYQLRGMATLPEFRAKGVGAKLIQTSIKILKEKNTELLWCNAREVAYPFYKKQGFVVLGKPYTINLIGLHYVMYKTV
ncbi:GNAT family N-acetyltransferase [Tenacibaculum sp. UWU-22]|uniref:GNAT family N-acetyltransferase n=1 Tax=Tenacibaculum sp. UWU-22 TaxID=3234187 RepID=UPI0034DB7426